MSEKCFCHLNGYQVKDSVARAGLENKINNINISLDTLEEILAYIFNEKFNEPFHYLSSYFINKRYYFIPENLGGGSAFNFYVEDMKTGTRYTTQIDMARSQPFTSEDIVLTEVSSASGGSGEPTLVENHGLYLDDKDNGYLNFICDEYLKSGRYLIEITLNHYDTSYHDDYITTHIYVVVDIVGDWCIKYYFDYEDNHTKTKRSGYIETTNVGFYIVCDDILHNVDNDIVEIELYKL